MTHRWGRCPGRRSPLHGKVETTPTRLCTTLQEVICVSILYWCFSFWLTSLCIIGSSFIHLIRTDSNAFFLMAE